MPIAEEVAGVLYEGKAAADVVASLMQRETGPELSGIAG